MFGRKKKLLARFRSRFGSNPLDEAAIIQARDRLPQIRIFNDMAGKPDGYDEYSIDDVSWSDLEMDEVFLRIDHTHCYIGEQVLYETLHSGRTDWFRQGRDWMEGLSEDEKARLELEYELNSIGKKQENYYLPEFFCAAEALMPEHAWVYRLLQVILVTAIALAAIFRTAPFLIFLSLSAGTNFLVYTVFKLKNDVLLSSMGSLTRILDLSGRYLKQKETMPAASDGLAQEWQSLRGLRRKLGKYYYLRQGGAAGDLLSLLMEYFFGITMIDIVKLGGILKMINDNRGAVEDCYRFLGRLDAAVSVLSFRKSLSEWSYPQPPAAECIRVTGLYHPLVKDPVCNDFTLDARAIITGANASGKSTFMKALAVSAILSQTIDTCCAAAFSVPAVKVMTSMAIRDDVVTGESYYVREVRYLKRMLDAIGSGKRTLFIIDEILKGTNQKERLAASEAVLDYISRRPGFCVVATHDLALVERLMDKYDPYYFESIIEEGKVSFTYLIRRGLGGDTNALALLRAFDFPEEILAEARDLV